MRKYNKIKTVMIDNKKYYSLYAAAPMIGLTYHEVYHNYAKWEAPLGLIKFRNRVYCSKSRAQDFMSRTPGYVPIEYVKKREPFAGRKIRGNAPDIRIIHGSVWALKLSCSENKA